MQSNTPGRYDSARPTMPLDEATIETLSGVAAPPSVASLTFVAWQQPIGCGGVAIFPDDILVADEDGAVVIPSALLDEVTAEAAEQEQLEAWIVSEIQSGAALPGMYPINAENKARYRAYCARLDKAAK